MLLDDFFLPLVSCGGRGIGVALRLFDGSAVGSLGILPGQLRKER